MACRGSSSRQRHLGTRSQPAKVDAGGLSQNHTKATASNATAGIGGQGVGGRRNATPGGQRPGDFTVRPEPRPATGNRSRLPAIAARRTAANSVACCARRPRLNRLGISCSRRQRPHWPAHWRPASRQGKPPPTWVLRRPPSPAPCSAAPCPVPLSICPRSATATRMARSGSAIAGGCCRRREGGQPPDLPSIGIKSNIWLITR